MENWDVLQCSTDAPFGSPCLFTFSEAPTSHFTFWSEEEMNELDSIMSTTPTQSIEQPHQRIHSLVPQLEPKLNSQNKSVVLSGKKIEDPEELLSRKNSHTQKKSRRQSVPWTKDEHRLFLMGLDEYGKGDWKSISRFFVGTKDASQVASHAQKYFMRCDNPGHYSGRRTSILDVHTVDQPIKPKLRRSQIYRPIAPSLLPPSTPIIQPGIDYKSLERSRIHNKYYPTNLFPIENISHHADAQNEHNFHSSCAYMLNDPCSNSQPSGFFFFANHM